MSRAALLILLPGLAVAFADGPEAPSLPEPLRVMSLNVGHPTMTPVRFAHALHVDPVAMGRSVSCAECHHPLADDDEAVPRPCASCHRHAFEVEERDESVPHEHDEPPDL